MSPAYSDWIQIVTWEVHTAETQKAKAELATYDNVPLIWNSECMHAIPLSSTLLIIYWYFCSPLTTSFRVTAILEFPRQYLAAEVINQQMIYICTWHQFLIIDFTVIFTATSMLNKRNMSANIECLQSTSKANNKESIPPSLDQVSTLPYYQLNGRAPPLYIT